MKKIIQLLVIMNIGVVCAQNVSCDDLKDFIIEKGY